MNHSPQRWRLMMTDVQVESTKLKAKLKTKPKTTAVIDVIEFDEAVVEGKKLVKELHSNENKLGELADRLEPKYGDKTLDRFAKEIGVNAGTLKRWRSTYRKWKGIEAPEPVSASV